MSKVITDNQHYSDIADAIRAKGISGAFKPAEMPAAIEQIQSGGEKIGVVHLGTTISVYTGVEATQTDTTLHIGG